MAQIARCPACKTRFKVVPDQLRIADGWVRCGRCGQLFNARAQHQSTPGAEPAAWSPSTAAPSTPDLADAGSAAPAATPSGEPSESRAAAPTRDGANRDGGLPALDPYLDAPRPAADLRAEIRAATGTPGDNAPTSADANRQRTPPPAPVPGSNEGDETEPAWAAAPSKRPDPATAAPPDVPQDPTFNASPAEAHDDPVVPAPRATRDLLPASPVATRADDAPFFARSPPRRMGFWHARAVRIASWPLAIVLALLLLGQWLHAEADWLAARWTPMAPAVEALCVPFLCHVEPYRQLDAIRIEDSGLKALDGNTFRLDIAVRNDATVAVAVPSFELTLSDLSRQVLVRRVISATELGAPPVLAARSTFEAARALRIGDGVRPEAIANYQVIAFYP